VVIQNCDLCPAGVEGRLTAVSTYCVDSYVNATGNTLFLNNGCEHSGAKTCR